MTDTSEASKNAELIRGLYAAVNAKDLATLTAFGADDSEWLDVPFAFTSKGPNAIVEPWQAWFAIFPDATCEVQSLVAGGDHVVAQGIGRGTHRGVFDSPAGKLEPTGRRMQTNFCDIYRLRDGKIYRADSYFDFFALHQILTGAKSADQ